MFIFYSLHTVLTFDAVLYYANAINVNQTKKTPNMIGPCFYLHIALCEFKFDIENMEKKYECVRNIANILVSQILQSALCWNIQILYVMLCQHYYLIITLRSVCRAIKKR